MSSNTSSASSYLSCVGSVDADLTQEDLRQQIDTFLQAICATTRDDVLLIPPDYTRFHSQAGLITQLICQQLGFIGSESGSTDDAGGGGGDDSPQTRKKAKYDDAEATTAASDAELKDQQESNNDKDTPTAQHHDNPVVVVPNITILPALGTHAPMTLDEMHKMFGTELAQKHKEANIFKVHDWRNDVVTIGHVPAEMVEKATRNMVRNKPWPAQLNRFVWDKRHLKEGQQHKPLIISIGQVVPHEVMGMANYNKNLLVGTGGVEAINLSHFIGACYGMEQMMGRQTNPLRDILNYASREFLEQQLDLWYILTVVSPHKHHHDQLCIRGLFIGNDIQCYNAACELSLKANFTMLDQPVLRMVTYLDPDEFHSTWLGNKAIYRTRMAMADGGNLMILAPGVRRFGEDSKVDELIRKYGYKGTPATLKTMEEHIELQDNLSAVAHLIHGSTEGRFTVTYCPGHLSRNEIEAVGFQYDDLATMSQRYDVTKLRDGWNTDDDGEFYFIRNPALGLWAVPSRFETSATDT